MTRRIVVYISFVVTIVFHLTARSMVKVVCGVVWLAHVCGHVVDVCICVCVCVGGGGVGGVVGRSVVGGVGVLLVVVVRIEDVLVGTIVG